MKEYELAVVLHPDLEMDLKGALSRLEAQIVQDGGKILKKDEWGKQKLAYAIGGQQFGIHVIYQLELDPLKVAEVEQAILLSEEVLRHLLVVPAPEPADEEAKPAKPSESLPATKPKAPAAPTVATKTAVTDNKTKPKTAKPAATKAAKESK